MIASTLQEEHFATSTGYARLVSLAREHGDREDGFCGEEVSVLDDFDERVAGRIVARLREKAGPWTVRSTGDVVLDVLEQCNLLEPSSLSTPARELVQRAHRIARQIVPPRTWAAGQ